MTEWTKYRNKLELQLADAINVSADDIMDFLHVRNHLEYEVMIKVKRLSDDDFSATWDRYKYILLAPIKDVVAEIEEGD